MRFRVLATALLFLVCAAAQTNLTIDQLVSFIKSSIQMKQDDRQVAGFLRKCKLSQRLDDRTIEDLQGQGAGPKTVEALKALRDESQSLPKAQVKPPAPPPAPIPPPSAEEQARVLSEARENALQYSKSLPDFICTEVTRRYLDPRGLGMEQSLDTITARLSYFEQKEDYKVVLVNNRPIINNATSVESLGGASSRGEFGSMLRELFEPRTGARFEWVRWATMRGKRAHVYSYRVPQFTSQYHITYKDEGMKEPLDIVAGYRGEVWIERDTNLVLQIYMECEDIPASFPVQQASTTLAYDYSKIADHDFLLPLRAEVKMRHDRELTRNEKEFRTYRKYSADAVIKFDTELTNTPAPLPDSKLKEEPAGKK